MEDKEKVFRWLTRSNLTAEMLGPPKFPDTLVPSWEEFDNDYLDYYFDGTQPMKGRCFIITHKGQEVGQINYNHIDPRDHSTELDIWLSDKRFTGQGFGTGALRLICRFLAETFGCRYVYVQPSRRNPKAIRAYLKAGFREQAYFPPELVPDYEDSVLLKKTIGEK